MNPSKTRIGYLLTFAVVVAFAIYPSVAPVGISSGASPLGFVLAAMVCSLVGGLCRSSYAGALPHASSIAGSSQGSS